MQDGSEQSPVISDQSGAGSALPGARPLGCCGVVYAGRPDGPVEPPQVIYVDGEDLPRVAGGVTFGHTVKPVPHAGETLVIHEYTLSARITRSADAQIAETRVPVVPPPTE